MSETKNGKKEYVTTTVYTSEFTTLDSAYRKMQPYYNYATDKSNKEREDLWLKNQKIKEQKEEAAKISKQDSIIGKFIIWIIIIAAIVGLLWLMRGALIDLFKVLVVVIIILLIINHPTGLL